MPGITELKNQREYWNSEISNFDTIYSHKKSGLNNFLDKFFRKDMYQRFEYTMKNSEPIKDRTFLDVGCGTGRYSFEYISRGCKHVTGIDISDSMVEHCNDIAAQQGVQDKTTFIRKDLTQYNPEQKPDVCIGIGLFDYIKNPLPIFRKMHECTHDRVIVSFPRFWTYRAPIRKVRLLLRKCPVFFYTLNRVKKLLKESGFKKYSIEKVGKLFCVTAFIKS